MTKEDWMKKLLLTAGIVALVGVGAMAQGPKVINGAGSTFAYPLYSQWAYEYKAQGGAGLNYQSIGSGGGIQQINNRTVDFGASDAPLSGADLGKHDQVQFPTAMGGVAIMVNIRGIGTDQLKLSGPVLADIYLGTITKWNDPRIASLNKGLKLPDEDITVVHRADGSGTTWIFTNYLCKVSKPWQEKVGYSTAVNWPVGVGGKGSEGVTSYVKQVNGGIGYVEYSYAKQNHLTTVELKNKAGFFVKPTMAAFQAAAANADWAHSDHFGVVLTDQPGKDTWPIAGATFIILYAKQTEPATGQAILKFFDWGFRKGSTMAAGLDYIPLPMNVVDMIEAMWAKDVTGGGKALWNAGMQVK